MAIQIRSNQIKLADDFTFSGQVQVPTPSAGSDAATKAYVDAALPDSFDGGDGIVITDGAGTDTIAVDLATDPGLQFTSNKLDLKLSDSSLFKDSQGVRAKLKTESGGSLSVDVNGIYIADAAISNAKLANSSISGKALGQNLDALTAGEGISMSSYNGSAAVSDLTVQLDGATLAKSASGLKVANGGVDTTQLANQAVSVAKLGVYPARIGYDGDGSQTVFNIANSTLATGWEDGYLAFRNGMLLERVASSPSGQDQYTVAQSGANIAITFGSAPATGDRINVIAILVDAP